VDLYRFVSWCLVTISVVTLIWPVNIPLLALAYRVRQGRQSVDMEPGEFWWRCSFGSLGLACLSLVLLGLNYCLVRMAELPPGPVQLTLFLGYVPAGIGFLLWMLAFEDMLEATSVFLLYILLPGIVVLLIGRLTHSWETLSQRAGWLLAPT
jgi:hypothetical protein